MLVNADRHSRTGTVLVCAEEIEHQKRNGQVPGNKLFSGQSWDLHHKLLMMGSYRRMESHLGDVV